jgi:hypothetical protein
MTKPTQEQSLLIPKLKVVHSGMVGRCHKESNHGYHNYGAVGIEVCSQWRNDKNAFIAWSLDNGYKYEPFKGRNIWSIDRIDGTKGYNPDNCRWVNSHVQSSNQKVRGTKKFNYGLEKFTGIRFVKTSESKGKYIAVITCDYESVTLGRYDSLKEAISARNMHIINEDLQDEYPVQKYIEEFDNLSELIKHTEFTVQESRYIKVETNGKIVKTYKFDIDGIFICSYDSIVDAAKANNIRNQAHISLCLSKARNSAGGFRWSRTDTVNELVGKGISTKGKVEVYKDGKLVDTMDDMKSTSEKYGISRSTMSRLIKNGKEKLGYIFVSI